MAKKQAKKRNAQDTTLRNNRARQQEIADISRQLVELVDRVIEPLVDRVVELESRVSELEVEHPEGEPV